LLIVSAIAFLIAISIFTVHLVFAPEAATRFQTDFLQGIAITPPLRTHGERFNLFHVEAAFLLIAFASLVAALLGDRAFRFWDLAAKRAHTLMTIEVALSLIILSSLAFFVLQKFPNSADEYAYLFQAETFLQKRLWNQPHPAQEFFSFAHIAQIDGKWVSRFPPGWPLVLATGSFLGIPLWLINPLLGTLSLVFLFALARRIYDDRVAILSVTSVLFSAFFVFNSASYFSHTLCGLLIILFFYCELRFFEGSKAPYALAAGLFLGLAFITRYYSTVLCALPIGLHILLRRDPRVPRAVLWTFLGTLPLLGFILIYNYKITGNPFLFVTTWMDPNERLGFVEGYSWKLAWIFLVKHLQSFVYWTSPPILFLYFVHLVRSVADRSVRFHDLPLVTIAAGYLFWHTYGGNQYGPRFYYEAYPFAVLFVVAKLFRETPGAAPRLTQKVALAFFLVGFAWGALAIPVIAKREHRIIWERMDLYRLVAEEKLREAVVLLKSGTGVIRPMPARDLARNGIGFQNDVLYARDLGVDNDKLRAYFPDRKLYVYRRYKDEPKGTLIEVGRDQPGRTR